MKVIHKSGEIEERSIGAAGHGRCVKGIILEEKDIVALLTLDHERMQGWLNDKVVRFCPTK